MGFPARRRDRPVESQVSPRAAWYDRNPVGKEFYYISANTPHTETERWTYTVPTGKKAFGEFLVANLTRVEVATTLGSCAICLYFKPSGLTEAGLTMALMKDNTLGATFAQTFGQNLTMLVGDRLRATTQDLSTAGTINYCVAVKLTEFDA